MKKICGQIKGTIAYGDGKVKFVGGEYGKILRMDQGYDCLLAVMGKYNVSYSRAYNS